MSPYRATLHLPMGMVSTVGGQRRILKRNITVIEYIRKAVESGVYRTREEMEIIMQQRKDGIEDLRTIMTRLRQDIVRGSLIQDYPREYLILEQHPPIPDPPRTPKRILRQLKPPPNNALQQLTKKYVQKYAQQTKSSVLSSRTAEEDVDPHTGGPLTSDEYYRRLLGVQASSSMRGGTSSSSDHHATNASAPLGGPTLYQKPVLLQKAYSAAVLHYQLLSQQPKENEATTMSQVDDMLSQQVAYEQSVARERRTTIQREAAAAATTLAQQLSDDASRRRPSPTSSSTSANAPFPFAKLQLDGRTSPPAPTTETPVAAPDDDDDNPNPSHHPTLQSIFHSDPSTIEGMMRWSERLQAVPYAEWTIGAATALDHWIARQVLQLSELTWQATLEGYHDDANAATYYLSLGRDIVACREAIFPETQVHLPSSRRMEEEEEVDLEDQWSSAAGAAAADNVVDDDQNLFGIETSSAPSLEKVNETRSIEDLLQRLGGLRSPDAILEPFSADNMTTESEEDATDRNVRISRLVNELQNWRRRNMEVPYDQWEPIDQDKFYMWMKKYVSTVSSEAEKRQERKNQTNRRDMIDYDATRVALLADPPVSAEESNEFWNQLQDESMVEILLDNMIEDGPPPGASILHESFWELPRKTQLHQLLNLGAVRPLLDEYTKESDRLRFLRRYGDAILTGVPLEHLVPDPAGPIKASDLSRDLVSSLRIGEQDRFRLEKLPYQGLANVNDRQRQQDAFEKSRLLYKAWNEHKSGRARYEEKLFQTGRLGLRYNDELDINAKPTKSSDSAETTPPKRR